jgi:hypothetical protein
MQKRLLPMLLALFCAAWPGGCTQERITRWATTDRERAEAVRFAEALRTGDRSFLESRMEAEAWRQSESLLGQARAAFAPGPVRWRVTAAGMHTIHEGPVTTVTKVVLVEGRGRGRWYLAEVVTSTFGGPARVVAWSVTPFASRPGAEHAFTLWDKPPLQWLWLLLCLAMPLVSLAAIVSIWRGPRIRRRPLWTVGCLLGFVRFTMNWTTGQTMVVPISLHVLSAAVGQPSPYAPWFLTFAIPIFAMLYFALRKRLRAGAAAHGSSLAKDSEGTSNPL